MSTVVNSFQSEIERAPRNVTKLGEKIVFVTSVNAPHLFDRRAFVKWNTSSSMMTFIPNYRNVHAHPFIMEYLFKAPGHSRLLSHIVTSEAREHNKNSYKIH